MSTIKVTPEVKREIERYRQFMLEQEYTSQTATGYSTYLSRFLRKSERCELRSLQQRISDFLEEQHESNPGNYKECRAAVYLYFKMVEGICYPKRLPKESSPEIETIIKQFYDYSVGVKRIRPSSASREVVRVKDFLEYITGKAPYLPENVTAHDVREYVVVCLAHMTDSSKGREITALRNFFRFQKFKGASVHESIFLLPLSPAVWKNSAFPTTIDMDVFDSLHEIPDRNTLTGKRNSCIILCFTELALRCIEVAALTIDDFDWREGSVAIKNTKNRSDRKLPVSEKLGRAIIDYLEAARPRTESRILFVRFKHVCGEPMGCSQIRGVVRRAYAKTGADIYFTGPHILRRTAATKIYNSGNSLKMTADILGHESLDSTVRYAKTDMFGLRQVAAAWPCMAAKAGVHDE